MSSAGLYFLVKAGTSERIISPDRRPIIVEGERLARRLGDDWTGKCGTEVAPIEVSDFHERFSKHFGGRA